METKIQGMVILCRVYGKRQVHVACVRRKRDEADQADVMGLWVSDSLALCRDPSTCHLSR